MRHAIQYALTYPDRFPSELLPLDLAKLSSLHFEEPDLERFPCILLAYRALKTGGTLPAAMNAANEEAVQAFIEERISFSDIPRVIEGVMDEHRTSEVKDLDAVLGADREARVSAQSAITQLARESRATTVA
jgi:1-deoxy-D-xylulose-5-phosphate reductoisomerase